MPEMYKDIPAPIRDMVKHDDAFRESLGIEKERNYGGRPKGTTKEAMKQRQKQAKVVEKHQDKALSSDNTKRINFLEMVEAIGQFCDKTSYDSMMNCIRTYKEQCKIQGEPITRAGLYMCIGVPKNEIDLWKAGKCTPEQYEVEQYIETMIDFFSESALVTEKGAVSKIYMDKTRNDVIEPQSAKDIIKPKFTDSVVETGEAIAEKYAHLLVEEE